MESELARPIWVRRRFVPTVTMGITPMLVRPMDTMGQIIFWAAFLLAPVHGSMVSAATASLIAGSVGIVDSEVIAAFAATEDSAVIVDSTAVIADFMVIVDSTEVASSTAVTAFTAAVVEDSMVAVASTEVAEVTAVAVANRE